MISFKVSFTLIALSFFALSFSGISKTYANNNFRIDSSQDNSEMPIEISSMLLSSNFYQLNSTLQANAQSQGQLLKIVGYSVLRMTQSTYGYIYLATRSINNDKSAWKPFGNIVSKINSTINGDLYLDGMWYEPIAEPPGGATVGN